MASPALSNHLILLVLLLLTNYLSAQTYHNISLGTTLTPLTQPTSWPSPSGDFAFGFRPLETDATLFLLAIWFDKIANKTVIWTANGDNPVRNGSKAELTSNGQLSLKDHTGQEIWNAGVNNAYYGAMIDTGNFVLVTAQSVVTWQSFDNPTDTILPTQVLEQGSQLYARLMDTDYSRGRFVLVVQNDGNLVFYPVAFPTSLQYDAYWASGTAGSGVRLVFSEDGSIYLSFEDNSDHPIISTTIITGDYYQRATLDPDGVFRQYVLPKNEPSTGDWVVKGTVASDICELVLTGTGSGACGFNSYCILDADGRPDCLCPPYYSFLDPVRKYKGCKPDFTAQSCEPGGEAPFDFLEIANIDWPFSDAEKFSPMNETQCKDNCLKDCFCSVAIFKSGICWKKKFPLSNGKMASTVDRTAFIKISKFNSSRLN